MSVVLQDYKIRDKESFLYAREITKPFGGIDSVISWCKDEMQYDWRWQVIEPSSDIRPGRYCFFFDSDKDLCAFIMKWQ